MLPTITASMPGLVAPIASLLGGLRVLESDAMVDYAQVNFPKSKNRRIRRKWTKRQANWGYVPKPHALLANNTLMVHPETWAKVRDSMVAAKLLTVR